MTAPWSEADIRRARSVPLLKVLSHIAAYLKEDRDYTPADAASGSRRFHVNAHKRDFRLILTGDKWLDELVDRRASGRGGGGAIDLVAYLTGAGFVQAVKICLDAADAPIWDVKNDGALNARDRLMGLDG